MGKYDVAIIGSGLGGLVCGFILSKFGYKVVVLEKNAQIGGCLQTFRSNGVKYDTGMHYIGSMEENQVLHRYFAYLDLFDKVKLSKLDENGFDTISVNDEIFRIPMGYERFEERLSAKFPHNGNDIKRYIHALQDVAKESPLYNIQEIHNNVFLSPHTVKWSVNQFIEDITDNKKLQNVLLGNLPLYAGEKDKTPMYVHALIHNFYIQSAYRIVGGSDSIAKSLASSIQNYGGQIYNHSEVVKVNCNSEKAVSVTLKNGEIVAAKNFISNIHPDALLSRIDTPLIRKAYRERVTGLDNTISNFTVYVKFKKNSIPYLNSNFYHYDTQDVWDDVNYTDENWPLSFLYMHQATAEKQQFADGAMLIAYMKYDDVARWAGTPIGNRGDEYLAFKEHKSHQLLQKLEKSFPETLVNIESYSSSSPLTYEDYTATKRGSMYGIMRDVNSPVQSLVSQRTRIPNLFMTGQNINSHGILGVTIGALITCAEFVGINTIIQDINRV